MSNFSVLMSVYVNTKPTHFFECLNSINNQSLLPSEIIIVKDGELNFKLDDFILKFNELNIKIIINEVNLGLPRSLNKGLKYCCNEIIFRMDSDDVCLPDRFKLQFQRFELNDKLAVLGTNVELIDNDSNEIVEERNVPLSNKDIRKIISFKNPFNHPSVVYKKSIILSVGGYSDLYLYEDWYLWIKLSRLQEIEFENMNEKLLRYRIRTFNDRKGYKIVKTEFKFYSQLLSEGYINNSVFLLNVTSKFFIRIMPSFVYNFFKHKFDKIK